MYSELLHETFHPKIKEAIQVLLTALRFNNKAVAQIASDMLLLLSDHVKNFVEYYPEVPKMIVEVLARTLVTLSPGGQLINQPKQHYSRVVPPAIPTDDEKRLLLSLLFCLGEWAMRVPRDILTQTLDNEGRTLLHHVFNALLIASYEPLGPSAAQVAAGMHHQVTEQIEAHQQGRWEGGRGVEHQNAIGNSPFSKGGRTSGEPMGPVVMMTDFDPNIHVDNTKEGYNIATSNLSPIKVPTSKKGKNEVMDAVTKAAVAATVGAVAGVDNIPAASGGKVFPQYGNYGTSEDNAEGKERDHEDMDRVGGIEAELDEMRRNCPIRLASKTLMSHLVNHLFHFPMGVGGGASLSSMVNEHDDNPHYNLPNSSSGSPQNPDELSAEIFKAPNVQFFVVNETTLMSFVELPGMTSNIIDGPSQQSSNTSLENSYADFPLAMTSSNVPSQVRIIFRDISGKFSWDINPFPAPRINDAMGGVFHGKEFHQQQR